MQKLLILLSLLVMSCAHLAANPQQIRSKSESIVLITGKTDKFAYAGTGFSIKEDGQGSDILTNSHMCQPNAVLSVEDSNHNQYRAKFIRRAEVDDLCLIRVDAIIPALKLAEKDAKFGDAITVIGYGKGIGPQIQSGYAEKYQVIAMEEGDQIIVTRAQMVSVAIYGGNSGSPVLDKDGIVIGIIFCGRGDAEHINYMEPVEIIHNFLDRKSEVMVPQF